MINDVSIYESCNCINDSIRDFHYSEYIAERILNLGVLFQVR